MEEQGIESGGSSSLLERRKQKLFQKGSIDMKIYKFFLIVDLAGGKSWRSCAN